MDEIRQRCLSRLPDLPLWVETRDLLLRENSRLFENSNRTGFVVWSTEAGLGSVVGEPEPRTLAQAAGDVPELLAFPDNIERVRSLVPEFNAEIATVFSAPEQLPPAPPHRCGAITLSEISAQTHLPDDLFAELAKAAEARVPVVAAFDGPLPVAFSYVASETESLWDVSIDTIESHRRQGYAAAAALHLIRSMKRKGKSAVWGALESNRASANLAHRLGFLETGRLWVLSRRTTWPMPNRIRLEKGNVHDYYLPRRRYRRRTKESIYGGKIMSGNSIFAMKFSRVYPLYVQKAERKNRTKNEVDEIIRWLTGYSQAGLEEQIQQEVDFATFFAQAPEIHVNAALIKGVVCGVRVEEIADPLMRKIRYLDKLIDELAKGKAMEKILR